MRSFQEFIISIIKHFYDLIKGVQVKQDIRDKEKKYIYKKQNAVCLRNVELRDVKNKFLIKLIQGYQF